MSLTGHLSKTALFMVVIYAWPSNWSVPDRNLDLFVLVGQSNMQGYMGNGSSYPKKASYRDTSILFFYIEPTKHKNIEYQMKASDVELEYISTWQLIYDEIHRSVARIVSNIRRSIHWPPHPSPSAQWSYLGPQWGRFPKGHFGPEISFARNLHSAGLNPAIFKYSKASTSLEKDWMGPGEGGLYDHFAATLHSAIIELRHQGYNVNIRGFIWLQGESDAGSDLAAARYADQLRTIVRHLRGEFLAPRAAIILGADEAHPMMLLRPNVRKAQEDIAQSEVCTIRSSMLGLRKADFTHLTPEALVVHGERLYRDYLGIGKECS